MNCFFYNFVLDTTSIAQCQVSEHGNIISISQGIANTLNAIGHDKFYTNDVCIIAVCSLIIALISLIIAVADFWFQRRTAQNVAKPDKKMQQKLILAYFRMLYLNKIKVRVLSIKLEEMGYERYYPSEEVIMRLKINANELNLREANVKRLLSMNNFLRIIESYNIEVELTMEYLKNPAMFVEEKKRRLDRLSLMFGFLTKGFINVLSMLNLENKYLFYPISKNQRIVKLRNYYKKIVIDTLLLCQEENARYDNSNMKILKNDSKMQEVLSKECNKEKEWCEDLFELETGKKDEEKVIKYLDGYKNDFCIYFGKNFDDRDQVHLVRFL